MNSYSDLKVWQKAMDLVVECYKFTKSFPKEERFGLSSQLQRAAVSIPSNIAEGHARSYTKSFLYHLAISKGSLAELETQILLAQRLGYTNQVDVVALIKRSSEIGKMLNGLVKALESRTSNQDPGIRIQ